MHALLEEIRLDTVVWRAECRAYGTIVCQSASSNKQRIYEELEPHSLATPRTYEALLIARLSDPLHAIARRTPCADCHPSVSGLRTVIRLCH